MDELDRLFELLVRALSRETRLAVPFVAAEVYERLVPYRSNRSAMRVAAMCGSSPTMCARRCSARSPP